MRPLLILSLLAALPANAEEATSPLDAARAFSAEGPLYTYDVEYVTNDITALGSVDPTQPEGSRITVSSPAREDWPDGFEKGLKEMDAEVDGDIWCTDFIKGVPDDAELVSQNQGVARYEFVPVPEDKEDEKFVKHLTGTIDIDVSDGAILGFSMASKSAFKPNIMVKIKSFQLSAACERSPDGRTYMAEVATKISGSAAMQSFDDGNVQKITALYLAD